MRRLSLFLLSTLLLPVAASAATFPTLYTLTLREGFLKMVVPATWNSLELNMPVGTSVEQLGIEEAQRQSPTGRVIWLRRDTWDARPGTQLSSYPAEGSEVMVETDLEREQIEAEGRARVGRFRALQEDGYSPEGGNFYRQLTFYTQDVRVQMVLGFLPPDDACPQDWSITECMLEAIPTLENDPIRGYLAAFPDDREVQQALREFQRLTRTTRLVPSSAAARPAA
jgi:hypothetical protein